jgi:hypothetical protein
MPINACPPIAPVLGLVAAGPSATWARARPDFSGEWVPGSDATNDVRYELIDGGKRLRATEQGRSPMGPHDAVWIYDRR